VLIIACANVAGLLLARAMSRQQEMAVRMAIGASRWRLLRQLIAETAILFTFGGIAGVVVARVLTALVLPLLPSLPFPVMVPLTVDVRVIAFTAIVSFAAALVFGLTPALQTARADLVTALKRDAHGSATRSRLRGAFVVAQVAFSLLLIVVAGLFVRALAVAGSWQPGFDSGGVQLVTFDLSMGGYTDASGPRFWRELRERVRQLPDVQSATLARVLPGGFEGIGLGGVSAPDAAPDPRGDFQYSWNIVDVGYFETLRIPLIAGRDFTDGDVHGAPPVVIVGQAAARRFWPNESAVGKTVSLENGRQRTALRVVGVAGDVRSSSLVDGLAGSYVYLPLQQNYRSDMTGRMTIAIRSAHDAAIADSVRAAVASMDPRLAAVSSESLDDATALGRVPQRLFASFSGTLGAVGLLLAAIGVYGITAYAAARRRRELGIRIALGATRGSIVSLMLRQGAGLTVAGCAIGLTLAAGASQVLGVFLLGMPALHIPTFLGAGAVFLTVGLVACYLPAGRATTIDPLECLRQE